MTNNRTTELLQELRDLACDIHAAEIIDHVHVTHRGWTFESQWLDSWHAEFDRITDKLDQAIAATLGSGTCEMEYGGDITLDTARVMGVYFCSECGSPIYNDCMPHFCIYCGKAVKR